MAEWTLHYVSDTLDAEAEAIFDIPFLVSDDADYAILGLRVPSGGAGWFKGGRPADPAATSLVEMDPNISDWESVDLRTVGPIAPAARGPVIGQTREWADIAAADGYEDAAAELRAVAAAL
jgi:hypothetical protein